MVVAARRLVRAAAANPPGTCLVVRLRAPSHGRRPDVPDREHPGRVHPGVPVLIRVRRKLASWDVLDAPSDLFLLRGVPGFIRSDNGPEFVAGHVRRWITTTADIKPGSPWENSYVESFNARFRDELLDREIFTSLREAQILIEVWHRHYNTSRPHSALGYRPPAPETIVAPSRAPCSAALRRLPGLAAVPLTCSPATGPPAARKSRLRASGPTLRSPRGVRQGP